MLCLPLLFQRVPIRRRIGAGRHRLRGLGLRALRRCVRHLRPAGAGCPNHCRPRENDCEIKPLHTILHPLTVGEMRTRHVAEICPVFRRLDSGTKLYEGEPAPRSSRVVTVRMDQGTRGSHRRKCSSCIELDRSRCSLSGPIPESEALSSWAASSKVTRSTSAPPSLMIRIESVATV